VSVVLQCYIMRIGGECGILIIHYANVIIVCDWAKWEHHLSFISCCK